MIGIAENKLRVITPEVGGGFGSKLNVYAEEALLGWIAMQLGKPVKWIETRRENIQATIHGRGQVGYIEIGCKNDGTLTGTALQRLRGSRRLSSIVDARRFRPYRVNAFRRLQNSGDSDERHRLLYEQDGDRATGAPVDPRRPMWSSALLIRRRANWIRCGRGEAQEFPRARRISVLYGHWP